MDIMSSMVIYFYKTGTGRSPIKEFIDGLPEEDQARFLEVIDEVEAHGFSAVRLVFKPIQGKLWEIKFRSTSGGYRIFYVLVGKDEMIWLHAFQKKTQKTPKKELQIAMKRIKEVMS